MWPERFPIAALQRIAKDESTTSHVAAGQLQQRPTAAEGGLFKRNWFAHTQPIFDHHSFVATRGLQLVRAWDLAWTAAEHGSAPDYTVGVLMGFDPESKICYVLNVVRGRWSPAELTNTVVALAAIDGEACRIRIPQDPGGGKFVAHVLAGHLRGYAVTAEPEHAPKVERAVAFAAYCENQYVVLAEALWNQPFIEELCAFPNGSHDDQVDAACAAYRTLMRRSQLAYVGA